MSRLATVSLWFLVPAALSLASGCQLEPSDADSRSKQNDAFAHENVASAAQFYLTGKGAEQIEEALTSMAGCTESVPRALIPLIGENTRAVFLGESHKPSLSIPAFASAIASLPRLHELGFTDLHVELASNAEEPFRKMLENPDDFFEEFDKGRDDPAFEDYEDYWFATLFAAASPLQVKLAREAHKLGLQVHLSDRSWTRQGLSNLAQGVQDETSLRDMSCTPEGISREEFIADKMFESIKDKRRSLYYGGADHAAKVRSQSGVFSPKVLHEHRELFFRETLCSASLFDGLAAAQLETRLQGADADALVRSFVLEDAEEHGVSEARIGYGDFEDDTPENMRAEDWSADDIQKRLPVDKSAFDALLRFSGCTIPEFLAKPYAHALTQSSDATGSSPP